MKLIAPAILIAVAALAADGPSDKERAELFRQRGEFYQLSDQINQLTSQRSAIAKDYAARYAVAAKACKSGKLEDKTLTCMLEPVPVAPPNTVKPEEKK